MRPRHILAPLAFVAALESSSPSARACTETLTYMCYDSGYGEILTAPQVFIDYWGWPGGCSTSGCQGDTANEITILEQASKTFFSTGFAGSIFGTRWMETQTQYWGWDYYGNFSWHVSNAQLVGTTATPSWFSPNAYTPTNNPNYATARTNEVAAAIAHFRNFGYTVNPDAVIFLPVPPNTPQLSGCGRHTYYPANPVAEINYNPQLQCDYAVDGVSSTVSGIVADFQHEYVESLTNPRGGAWVGSAGQETADLCKASGGVRVALQPSSLTYWQQNVIATVSDAAGPNGACVFARGTYADLFGLGGNQDLYHYSPCTLR